MALTVPQRIYREVTAEKVRTRLDIGLDELAAQLPAEMQATIREETSVDAIEAAPNDELRDAVEAAGLVSTIEAALEARDNEYLLHYDSSGVWTVAEL